jgi:hypothetical protein
VPPACLLRWLKGQSLSRMSLTRAYSAADGVCTTPSR